MILLLTHGQQVSNSLMLCHNAHFIHLTLSYHLGILSSDLHHHKQGEYSTIRYFGRERDHIHITFITIPYNSLLLLLLICFLPN